MRNELTHRRHQPPSRSRWFTIVTPNLDLSSPLSTRTAARGTSLAIFCRHRQHDEYELSNSRNQRYVKFAIVTFNNSRFEFNLKSKQTLFSSDFSWHNLVWMVIAFIIKMIETAISGCITLLIGYYFHKWFSNEQPRGRENVNEQGYVLLFHRNDVINFILFIYYKLVEYAFVSFQWHESSRHFAVHASSWSWPWHFPRLSLQKTATWNLD